jgi:hypothetical protein
MARGLNGSGWDVELLCCRYGGDKRFFEVANAFPGPVVAAPFCGPFSSVINHRIMRRAVRLWWSLRGYVEREDYPEVVAPRLLQFGIQQGIQKSDVVFGYSGGHLESFVSAQKFSRHFGRPLVLEFRDPIPPPRKPPLDAVHCRMFESCLNDASLIVTTTNGIANRVADQFPFTSSRLRTIYSSFENGFPATPVDGEPNSPLLLVHAGRLFGGVKRNARSLVKAIAEAVRLDPSARNQIRLRLVGAGSGGDEAKTLARDLGIPRAVELVPQMCNKDCQEELRRADVLVVIKYNDPEYDQQIPGKLFHCLGFGKPILGIMRETEAADILRNSGLGLVFDHSDVTGTAATLTELLRQRASLNQRFRPDWEYIRQFSFEEMTRRFVSEFTAVAKDPSLTRPSRRCIGTVS